MDLSFTVLSIDPHFCHAVLDVFGYVLGPRLAFALEVEPVLLTPLASC